MVLITYDTDSKQFNFAGLMPFAAVEAAEDMYNVLAVALKKVDDRPRVNSITQPDLLRATLVETGKLKGYVVISAWKDGKEIAIPRSFTKEHLKTAYDNAVAGKVLKEGKNGLKFYACDGDEKPRKISNFALQVAKQNGYC